ncbi:hypothetical protein GCM10011613_36840 [Cellvibrio zantedeschiae]|uniref:Transposase n=1 Tax=Cellvibrio zantedeschiae TaxID=1237077 RepID=A0ABQ3BAN8_9GAMM|nr:hypothetical protein GCM10011613_36840 [Cellvibrio zantedeschiae]
MPFRSEQAKQGWAKQYTRNHLADDLGLVKEFFTEPANSTAGSQDDKHLEEKMD